MTPVVLGTLAAADDVVVDGGGGVAAPGGWRLDWLIGASDRWHAPGGEIDTAVSQRRLDGTPVVETAVRTPGGQVVHRAWCAVGAGTGDALVMEVENRSKEPVALAITVAGPADRPVVFDGDRAVSAGGGPRLLLGRVPAGAAAGDAAAVRRLVTAGEAQATGPLTVVDGVIAFVFPLAHTASLRVALGLDDDDRHRPPEPDRVPGAETVVRGWRGHVDAGARVALPDPALADAVVAARTSLLVQSDRGRPPGPAAGVALALAAWGHDDAATLAAGDLARDQRLDGGFGARRETTTIAMVLAAWAALARAGGGDRAQPLVGPAAKAAHRLARVHWRGAVPAWYATAQHDAAAVLDVAAQGDAADLCRRRAASAPAAVEVGPPVDLDVLLAQAAGIGGPDAGATASFLLGARDLLVDDRRPGHVALLRAFPDRWLGQDLEAHRLPTRAGRLSFAVRWHGSRPALLWELEADRPARIGIPGLDPAWSTAELSGEALLAPVPPAGGLPGVVAPLPVGGTPVSDAGDEGASFA